LWTISLETTPDALPKKPDSGAPAAPGAPPSPDALGVNVGSFTIILIGPGPAFEVTPAQDAANVTAQVTAEGAASFSGGLQAMMNKQTFEARFRGKPLPAAALAAEKKDAFVEPSASYRRLMDVLAQRKEKEAVKAAAAQAIADSQFTIRLVVGRNGKAVLQTTRAYFGSSAALFAGREAMLQAFLPGLAGNYGLEVKPVKGEDGRGGVAFVRTRLEELPLDRFGQLITMRQDGADRVYVMTVPALLADIPPPPNAPPVLGRLTLATPDPVTGTNGAKVGPNEAALDLTAAALQDVTTLIVRTTPGK
jgi:hypothetical protein